VGRARNELDRAITLALKGRTDEALATSRGIPDGWERWLEAYAAATRGEFPRAISLAEALASNGKSRVLRVYGSITAGSALRQTGRYREAARHDRVALSLARDSSERTHALIGLAADAIGLGHASLCGRRLAEAAARAPGDDWRCAVRLDWVRTERALAIGRADGAVTAARRALRRSIEADARRHVSKSHLFLGAALRSAGKENAARQHLQRALRTARACNAGPIALVARSMLADEPLRSAR